MTFESLKNDVNVLPSKSNKQKNFRDIDPRNRSVQKFHGSATLTEIPGTHTYSRPEGKVLL
jgi:hypothetical protein